MDPNQQLPEHKQGKSVPFLDMGSALNTLSKSPDQSLFVVAGRAIFKIVKFQQENGAHSQFSSEHLFSVGFSYTLCLGCFSTYSIFVIARPFRLDLIVFPVWLCVCRSFIVCTHFFFVGLLRFVLEGFVVGLLDSFQWSVCSQSTIVEHCILHS